MSQKYKNALPAAGGAAGSGDGPRLDPVAVQNYAYLKLLKWDHLHRPFPEVGAPGQADCSFLSCTAELLKNNSYNSHSRKVFLCKPCNSWDFSTFTQLCSYHHHPFLEIFLPTETLYPINNNCSSPRFLSAGIYLSAFPLLGIWLC